MRGDLDSASVAPAARIDRLVVTETGGELLLYDTEHHHIHRLNSTMAAIWRVLDGEGDIAAVAALATAATGERIDADAVRLALRLLDDAGLLVTSLPASTRVSRRAFLGRAAAAGAVAMPAIVSVTAAAAGGTHSDQCGNECRGDRDCDGGFIPKPGPCILCIEGVCSEPVCDRHCTSDGDCRWPCPTCGRSKAGNNVCVQVEPVCDALCGSNDYCAGADDGCTLCQLNDANEWRCGEPGRAKVCYFTCTDNSDCENAEDGCTVCADDGQGGMWCVEPHTVDTLDSGVPERRAVVETSDTGLESPTSTPEPPTPTPAPDLDEPAQPLVEPPEPTPTPEADVEQPQGEAPPVVPGATESDDPGTDTGTTGSDDGASDGAGEPIDIGSGD
jgi:hypothetical protein